MAASSFEQVTPHIFRLEMKFKVPVVPIGFPVNVFLVRYEGGFDAYDAQPAGLGDAGWILVDAGAPGFGKWVIEQALAHTGGELPKVLLLTHGHIDHVAAAQAVRTQWRSLVAAGRAEIPYLLGSDRYNRIAGQTLQHRLFQRSGPALAGRSVQIPLDDGRRLADFVTCHVPGHAPGMVALLHRKDRAVLAADTVFHTGGKLTDPLPPFTYSPKLNHESQARLAELDFDHLLPSHGAPILNTGRQALQALLAARQKKR
jgi:glyoxylase-like metal-dependent hydrolase (beta-lactamase superfamily II)